MLNLRLSLIPLVVMLVVPLVTFSQEPAPKLAVPDDAAQKAALAVIADVYKPDYEKAKTATQKTELAKKLLGEAVTTNDDPVSRFVLFRISRDIAAQQGDLVTAFDAIGRIGTEYNADALQMQVDAATLAVKALKTPKDHQACAVLLAPLIDEAIAVDRYDHAKSLVALTLGCARDGQYSDRIKQMTSKLKEVEEVAVEFEKVKVAKATLEAKPTDADANLAVGKFLCLFKGDWKRGVTMLALGGNEEFKATAMLELEEKPDALKLGDGWWKISDGLDGTAKTRTQAHAGEWYRSALPGLSGLTKARVESRLKDIGEVDTSFVNSVGIKLKLLPAGTFTMGQAGGEANEAPPHHVTLTKPFYIGVYEVTNAQWKQVMGSVPSRFKDGGDQPVETVSWDDAMEFCRRLSAFPEERKAGRVYRLPTEAEWEYACRAGTKTAYSFGDDESLLGEYGWFNGNSGGQTHPVGQKKPNPWGLYDMHGNVWEWVSDWHGDYPINAVTDPAGPPKGTKRVHRGGSWPALAGMCRSACANQSRIGFADVAFRPQHIPTFRNLDLGFRLALSPPEAGKK